MGCRATGSARLKWNILLKLVNFCFCQDSNITFKGATKLHTKVIFVSTTKIGESTTSILKLLFFTINLHFVKSNQISTYRKLNLPLKSSIYFVFLPLEMPKRLAQTKVPLIFILCLKRNDSQTF